MKKILFLSLLGLSVLFLGGCSLINNNDSGINTGDIEKISQLEQQLSGLLEQFSGLQAENQSLKETLSGSLISIQTLQAENQSLKETLSGSLISIQTLQSENKTLQSDVDKYKKMIVEDKLNSKNTTTTTQNNAIATNNIATNTNSKEIGLIKQIYVDQNGNRKLEIDYIQLGGSDQCNGGVACIINQNTKLRTFTISNNVEIIMQTLSYASDGSFNNNQSISFDYFKQKFNDTMQYNDHPYNYSKYMKKIPYRITIENNIITKIAEQYMS